MKVKDARKLSPDAQEALRYRVVKAVENGMSKSEASRVFKISRTAIHHWTKAVKQKGEKALQARKRGRRSQSRLVPHQAATTVRLITKKCPDQLGLSSTLWTREAVRQLLESRWGVLVSVWTVGRYLKRWGLTPHSSVASSLRTRQKSRGTVAED